MGNPNKKGSYRVSQDMAWEVITRFAAERGMWVCFTKRHVSEAIAENLGVSIEEVERSIHFHMLRIEKMGGLVKVGSDKPHARGRPRTLYMQPVYIKNADADQVLPTAQTI